jgi:uncharacterized protein with HEPN domain
MTRREPALYLADILEAAEAIAGFIHGYDADRFIADDRTRSAVQAKLIIIGEAANSLPAEVRARHGEVAWREMIGMRHVAAHHYFGLDWLRVYETARDDVPQLVPAVRRVLEAQGHS